MGNNVSQAFFEVGKKDDDPDINPENSFMSATSGIPSIQSIQAITSGSAVTLGGTISALVVNLTDIRHNLLSTNKYASSEEIKSLQGNYEQLSDAVTKIEGLIPDLQFTYNNLEKVSGFLGTYQGNIIDMLSAKSKLNDFEDKLTTLSNRIKHLEEQNITSINLKIGFWGLAVVIILGLIDFGIRFYLGK